MARHPIQAVARRTGLSVDCIRVWEKRYGAVTPQRDKTSQRVYTDEDIERLILLRRATQAGRRIGQIVSLSNEALTQLISDDRAPLGGLVAEQEPKSAPQRHLNACLQAVRDLSPDALANALAHAATSHPLPVLLEEIVSPLIGAIGREWAEGKLRVFHEHAATAQIADFLVNVRKSLNVRSAGQTAIVTTPVGQVHELGALMVSVYLAAEGFRTIYLNPSTPAAEIVAAAAQAQASVVALSVSYPSEDPLVTNDLKRVRLQLPEQVAVIVGGSAARAYARSCDEAGIVFCADFDCLRQHIDQLKHTVQ
ncbi:MAG: cobalamin-dependent protein [Pseudomonadota bacterium]